MPAPPVLVRLVRPREPKEEQLVQVDGGGVATWVPRSEAAGKPAAQAARGATGAERGTLANESAEDSMMDVAVYALIALRLYRESSQS